LPKWQDRCYRTLRELCSNYLNAHKMHTVPYGQILTRMAVSMLLVQLVYCVFSDKSTPSHQQPSFIHLKRSIDISCGCTPSYSHAAPTYFKFQRATRGLAFVTTRFASKHQHEMCVNSAGFNIR